jgi:tryptophan halogenase
MTKDIAVVGGGTAGWLTALHAKKQYPNKNITVIESSEIGILGAGEGSTPMLISFLEHLGISIADLIIDCDATIKNGIKFTNWNNDGGFYYHGFYNDLESQTIFYNTISPSPAKVGSLAINNGIKEIDFIEQVSEKNKIPLTLRTIKHKNKIFDFESLSGVSVHFNATKLANKLKEVALNRGIKIVDGKIKTVNLDEKQYVKSLTLENNHIIECDFVFDCSGFHRLIIGKTFNSKWKSYKEFLPVDSAIPFFIDMTDTIPPYTEAIAMKYGWMWKIPLQNRFGCGYVYDSSLISEQEAADEIETVLGYAPFYPRKDRGGFKFDAGCYEEVWINNCVAIGLSGNFIEPLEATSIFASIIQLTEFSKIEDSITGSSEDLRKKFNKDIIDLNTSISNFIYFHYMTLRKDTEFWQKFSYEYAPEKIKEKINIWNNRLPNKTDDEDVWKVFSWFAVGSGLELINKSIASTYIENLTEYGNSIELYNQFIALQNNIIELCVDHKQFLEYLK